VVVWLADEIDFDCCCGDKYESVLDMKGMSVGRLALEDHDGGYWCI
jgi:hypothetical protein